ncbi:MAG: hypothetical protein ABIY70_08045 [Capsulimonas sp.]|uniref:hypothetical protein n=1 Tax=Capsulimonas sp. TaxID=2494211 RepID=UPI003263AFF2
MALYNASNTPVGEDEDMGLLERRKIKELQDVTFPERTAELAEICGGKIAYDVDWDSFANDLEGLNFLDNLSCHRTNMALRQICVDDMGKDAVCDVLARILLKNVPSKADMRISFEGGVLEMHCAYALRTDGMFSDTEIRDVLLAGL